MIHDCLQSSARLMCLPALSLSIWVFKVCCIVPKPSGVHSEGAFAGKAGSMRKFHFEIGVNRRLWAQYQTRQLFRRQKMKVCKFKHCLDAVQDLLISFDMTFCVCVCVHHLYRS